MALETEWIEGARRGSAEAWEQLVQEHQQAVFRLAYLLVGDADDAEDLAQETFIHAHHALNRFESGRPLRPWLLRITTRLASNWRRSAGRYLMALQRVLRSEGPRPSTRQLAEQRLEDAALWEAIRCLSPADQQVVYLRYFLELSEIETSEVLQAPVGTVKSRLHRALARLRAVLEQQDPEEAQEKSDA